MIKGGGDIKNALAVVVEATNFNFTIARQYNHLTPVVLDYLKVIMCFSQDDYVICEVNYNDREKVIEFLNGQMMKLVKMMAEKSRGCLSILLKSKK